MSTAIIGGTGIGEILRKEGGEAVSVETAFGPFNALRHADGVIVVSRHGAGHKVPPHMVNYRALAAGLSSLGVETCLSTAAVGSVREEIAPGTLAVVTDFIDVSGRNITMFDEEVRHTDFSPGVSEDLVKRFLSAGIERTVVYACTNGPRYETPAEIRALRTLGADVVGMTMASEAVVMREVGIEYGCLAIVTNCAAGVSDKPLAHSEVTDMAQRVSARAVATLLACASP
ncbi:MAG: MTAP family purine nucleoside phosphorylase [Fimbriimonadales bacterium]